ncbi:MAG: MBL fold metallo-hydrolase [Candidatus Lokiarchaeota archaeon]|nr:MBL fold metallo-hydrolase [Candidatus Lokiarchaeota archaeon]
MIFEKLIVGQLGTNCYIFGSDKTNELVVIDPGGNAEAIISKIDELRGKPIAVLLTHGHFDHTTKVGKILRHFQIPLMFNKKEYDFGTYKQKEADRWLVEGDDIEIGEITLHTLETPGHSPGSLCFYSPDVDKFRGNDIDGIIFTGDLIFKGSIGRSDFPGGNQNLLFESIRKKIMHHKGINDNFIVCPGHMGLSTVREERASNMFRKYFI